MRQLFTVHPQSVGESYWEHMHAAGSFSARLFIASLCCLVHAVFPFLFEKTGSRMVTGLYERMTSRGSAR